MNCCRRPWHAVIERQLKQAEQLYRERGLDPAASHPVEQVQLQRLAVVGALMVAAGDELLQTERQRIEAQGEGLSAPDKARKLAELRRAVLRTAAQREIELRKIEGDGEFRPRPVHPELAIWKQAAVERLAAAR